MSKDFKVFLKEIILATISLVSLFIIVMAAGLDVFTIWISLPTILFYLLARMVLKVWGRLSDSLKIIFGLSFIALVLFPATNYLKWIFNNEPSISTSSVIFIFIPFWALLFGAIPMSILLFTLNKKKINKKL